ncbi:MAG: hypothetical protein ABGY42_01140, partial [bacterium]
MRKRNLIHAAAILFTGTMILAPLAEAQFGGGRPGGGRPEQGPGEGPGGARPEGTRPDDGVRPDRACAGECRATSRTC